jgi:hypothetical protein
LIRVIFNLLFLISILGLTAGDSYGESDSAQCLSLVRPLNKDKEDIQFQGGIWGIFSKTPSLGRHSSKAIAVDSKINKLIATLTYLCETRSGVPLNELATYVSRKLTELGKSEFKRLHVTLGKPEKDIEDWLEYTEIAEINKSRVLELEKIKKSIQGAGVLIKKYRALFSEFQNNNKSEPVLSRTISLGQHIDDFFVKDPYLALAIFEESQEPYWDVDENYGGS